MQEKWHSTTSPSGLGQWVRAQFRARSLDLPMLAAYAMILAAIVTFVLVPREIVPWRFQGTLILLSALLVINVLLPRAETLPQSSLNTLVVPCYLGLGAMLVLGSFALGGASGWTFIPFLLFVLAGQATTTLRLPYALGYAAVLWALFLATLRFLGADQAEILANALSISMGMLFVTLFSLVVVRFRAQTDRAEALLHELQTAHVALAAAREREKELATVEERVRLAREIHDGLGHHLTVLNVQLQAAGKLIAHDPQRAATAIATCREVAQAAMQEVRQSVAAMQPSPLDGRPLPEALKALVHDFDQRSSLGASFVQHGSPVALPSPAAMTVYRAAQEGLTNAQKHAVARQVTVALHFEGQSVRLTVANDGTSVGGTSGSGLGLAGLRERAEQLGGTLEAEAGLEGGFRLLLVLPLPRVPA